MSVPGWRSRSTRIRRPNSSLGVRPASTGRVVQPEAVEASKNSFANLQTPSVTIRYANGACPEIRGCMRFPWCSEPPPAKQMAPAASCKSVSKIRNWRRSIQLGFFRRFLVFRRRREHGLHWTSVEEPVRFLRSSVLPLSAYPLPGPVQRPLSATTAVLKACAKTPI